ncbi:hypothetical protein ACFQU2_26360 [Siccirubricoccus deserti]
MIGEGETFEAVAAAAAGQPQVHLLGLLENAEVLRVLARSRLMVHSSIWEGYRGRSSNRSPAAPRPSPLASPCRTASPAPMRYGWCRGTGWRRRWRRCWPIR